VCVVLPTYNNRATLAAVIGEVLAVTDRVIVVDDGSTDGTGEVLRERSGIVVVTHERNLGKGAALATGLARAAELGFTHAITMDTDGQHTAADIARLQAAIEANPEAIVVGVRDLLGAGARRKSRILRANSNFWVFMHTGRWIHDTQCGFRAYPLAPILALRLQTRKYDFEIEVLVKALWSGVPVVEVPVEVRYNTGSPSHFRPLADFWLVTHLNGCLFGQRLLMPASLRRVYHQRSFHQGAKFRRALAVVRDALIEQCGSPWTFALALGVGVFLGILPIWGFQMAAAVVVAHKLRLSKPLVLSASNISFPALLPFILWLSLVVGRFALTGRADLALSRDGLTSAAAWQYAAQYLVGAVLLAAVAGLAVTVLSYLLARTALMLWRRRRSCDRA